MEYVNKCNHEQVRLTSFSIFLMIFSVFKLLRLGAEKLKYGGKMTWYLVNVQVSIQMVPLVCLTCEKTSVVLEGWESGGGMYFINNCDYTNNIFIEWDLFPEITFDLCIPAFPLLN